MPASRSLDTVPLGGVQWTTALDYPGKVAAVLFALGCNFRCPFCHNPALVDPDRPAAPLDEAAVCERLSERVGFLDGVVVSGGEPTIHPGLPGLLARLKSLGLLVKLDTNGSRPDVLSEILGEDLVDYVAMDVKAPLDAYGRLTGIDWDVGAIEESIDRLVRAAPDYEFRTTVAPTLTGKDVRRIADRLSGAKRYFLQAFRVPDSGLVDPAWESRSGLSVGELEALWSDVRSSFGDGGVRG